MQRLRIKIGSARNLYNAPQIHHGNTVSNRRHGIEIVGNKENRDPARAAQVGLMDSIANSPVKEGRVAGLAVAIPLLAAPWGRAGR